MRQGFNRGVSLLLVGSLLATGCTKTQVTTVGRLEGPKTETLQRVPFTGTYQAMWTDSDRHHLYAIAGASRFAHTGEHLGFAKVDGQLLATHDDFRLPIHRVPSRTKYVVWYNQRTVETQFGREVDKATEDLVPTLQKAAVVFLVGALVVWLGYEAYKHPDSFFNSDDSDHSSCNTAR